MRIPNAASKSRTLNAQFPLAFGMLESWELIGLKVHFHVVLNSQFLHQIEYLECPRDKMSRLSGIPNKLNSLLEMLINKQIVW